MAPFTLAKSQGVALDRRAVDVAANLDDGPRVFVWTVLHVNSPYLKGH
jgi:hypothetical protein